MTGLLYCNTISRRCQEREYPVRRPHLNSMGLYPLASAIAGQGDGPSGAGMALTMWGRPTLAFMAFRALVGRKPPTAWEIEIRLANGCLAPAL
jgi:hypothetical protein